MNTTAINWGLLFQFAKKHGVTQRKIAAHINVKPPALSYWVEGNKRYDRPPQDRAEAVIDYLSGVLSNEEIDRCINAQ